jgi:hypothetical protein
VSSDLEVPDVRCTTNTIALACSLFVALAGDAVWAQGPSPTPGARDLSGIWNRLDTVGGGSYDGISDRFPQAQLLPEAAAKVPPPEPEPTDWGGKPITTASGAYLIPRVILAGGPSPTAGRCNIGGGGAGIDINSAGMAIMQSADEVIIARDGQAGGRRIYMNRTMAPVGRITPSPLGYSVGRLENGTVIATTTGMNPGIVAFGRGWKERETILTETFTLSPDNRRLTITYTWNDPKIYVKPHSYDITFERVENGYAFESWCDASIDHPENYTSIAPPAQR